MKEVKKMVYDMSGSMNEQPKKGFIKIDPLSPEAQEMFKFFKFLFGGQIDKTITDFIEPKSYDLWIPKEIPKEIAPSKAFYTQEPVQEDYLTSAINLLHQKEVAFKKKAADPKTTREVAMKLEACILATQTPEGRKEICDAFKACKRWCY